MQATDRSNPATTVGGVLCELARRPIELLLRRWNWKAALLSACVRGSIFFLANLGAGWQAASGAMLVESAFYFTIAGFYGAMIQAFRRARPAWKATLTVMALMPAINHSLELALHTAAGTETIAAAVAVSIALSMFSAAFNLFAMRRGALLVGAERQSLCDDLRQMPRIILDFATILSRLTWRDNRQPRVFSGEGG
jgi:hypothetical protein